MFRITSSRVIPTPLSLIVSVRAVASLSSVMCRSPASLAAAPPVRRANRSLSSASELFEISSRRKTSLSE
jgi:type II secretory pathway component PulK